MEYDNYHFKYFAISISIFLILSSYANKTVKHKELIREIPLTNSNREKIDKLGITVKTNENFSVRFPYIESTGGSSAIATPIVPGGSPGAALGMIFAELIIAAVIYYASKKDDEDKILTDIPDIEFPEIRTLSKQFKPLLNDYFPHKIMSERLSYYLQSEDSINEIEIINTENQNIINAKDLGVLLDIKIDEWGLYYLCYDDELWGKYYESCNWESLESVSTAKIKCYESPPPMEFKFGIKASGKIILLDDNSTIWENQVLYIDDVCYEKESLKFKKSIFNKIIDSVIDRTAHNIIKKIFEQPQQKDDSNNVEECYKLPNFRQLSPYEDYHTDNLRIQTHFLNCLIDKGYLN